mgnify:CR=1 FL=1
MWAVTGEIIDSLFGGKVGRGGFYYAPEHQELLVVDYAHVACKLHGTVYVLERHGGVGVYLVSKLSVELGPLVLQEGPHDLDAGVVRSH